jgi:hypothetical protein
MLEDHFSSFKTSEVVVGDSLKYTAAVADDDGNSARTRSNAAAFAACQLTGAGGIAVCA